MTTLIDTVHTLQRDATTTTQQQLLTHIDAADVDAADVHSTSTRTNGYVFINLNVCRFGCLWCFASTPFF